LNRVLFTGGGGSFSPKAPSFPTKRKEKEEKKREREIKRERGREGEEIRERILFG
jgi:hypothetical protein